MATRSNIASVIGSLADNSSDSDESDDESDSSDGLEVVEKRSTGKAGGTSYEESQETNTSYELCYYTVLIVSFDILLQHINLCMILLYTHF